MDLVSLDSTSPASAHDVSGSDRPARRLPTPRHTGGDLSYIPLTHPGVNGMAGAKSDSSNDIVLDTDIEVSSLRVVKKGIQRGLPLKSNCDLKRLRSPGGARLYYYNTILFPRCFLSKKQEGNDNLNDRHEIF